MIGNPSRLEAPRKIAQSPEVGAIQRIGRSDRHRNAMHRDRIVCAHSFQHLERASARDHKIFRNDLEPIYLGTSLEHVAVVLTSKPDTVTEHRKVGTLHPRLLLAAVSSAETTTAASHSLNISSFRPPVGTFRAYARFYG